MGLVEVNVTHRIPSSQEDVQQLIAKDVHIWYQFYQSASPTALEWRSPWVVVARYSKKVQSFGSTV